MGSDKTITPDSYAQASGDPKHPQFLSIFDPQLDEEDDGLLVKPSHFLEDVVDEEVNIQIE